MRDILCDNFEVAVNYIHMQAVYLFILSNKKLNKSNKVLTFYQDVKMNYVTRAGQYMKLSIFVNNSLVI